MEKTKTQEQRILEYLKAGNRITSLQALSLFGCFRLASRINDIKKRGFDVSSQMISNGNGKHYKEYWLESIQTDLFGEPIR